VQIKRPNTNLGAHFLINESFKNCITKMMPYF
jgi:hypothetical protein